MKTPTPEFPSPEDLARLRHEFAIGSAIDDQHIIHYAAIEDYHHGLALVEEDFGAVALAMEALGSNAQVLIEVFPDLELIVGQQPSAPELGPQEAHNRLTVLFQKEAGQAIEYADMAAPYLERAAGWTLSAYVYFYDSLARLAVVADQPRHEQQGTLKTVAANQEQLSKRAAHGLRCRKSHAPASAGRYLPHACRS